MKVLKVVLILGLLGAVASQACAADSTCKKGGKDLNVAGKTDADKKAACKKAGGTWANGNDVKAQGNGVGNGSH